jgi:hypothetical protein
MGILRKIVINVPGPGEQGTNQAKTGTHHDAKSPHDAERAREFVIDRSERAF